MALKGFNAISRVGGDVAEPINDLALWARRPYALAPGQIEAFVRRVRCGLELEQAYSPAELNRYMVDVTDILVRENQRLETHA